MKLIYKSLSFLILSFLLNHNAYAAQNYCTKEEEQSKFIIHIYGESYQNDDDKSVIKWRRKHENHK